MTTNMNVDDAREVDNQLRSIFDAWDTGLTNWVDETRKLFLLMDFEYENALVSLSPTPTGINQPATGLMFGNTFSKNFCIYCWMTGKKRCTKTS